MASMSEQVLFAAAPAYSDVLPRLGLDVVAIAVLVYGLFLRRHKRMDLVVVCAMCNVGLFLALTVIAGGELSMGVSRRSAANGPRYGASDPDLTEIRA
jgi:hypothetical protein